MSRRFGEEFDSALNSLYAYCVARNVPIMAHAAPTNFSGGYDFWDKENGKVKHNFFSEKASPAYWTAVVDKPEYKQLRLNLGHAGFDKGGWTEMILTAMNAGPNVLIISYFDEFMGSEVPSNGCSDLAGRAARFREPVLQSDPRWEQVKEHRWSRFMYGSDWFMCAKERHFNNYLDVVAKTWFSEVAKGEADPGLRLKQLLSANAARYLGLGLSSSAADSNYSRLKKYYGSDASHFRGGKSAVSAALKRLDQLAQISTLSIG